MQMGKESCLSTLKTSIFVVGCAFAAVLAEAGAMPFVRIGSGPLNASVGNERDAAIDRAVAWLVAAQSPEGHWGGSNVVATAAAALAIRGDREEMPKAEAETVERAVKWLRSPVCTNVLASGVQKADAAVGASLQRARAWRHLALAVLQQGSNSTDAVVSELVRKA